MTVAEVPVVDLGGSPAAITEALVGHSCAFVVGHSVPEEVRDALVERSRAFFDRPSAEKAAVRWPGSGLWRGWQPVLDGVVDVETTKEPALLERFEVALARGGVPDLAKAAAEFDLWPDEPVGFAAAYLAYYESLHGVASKVVRAIAETLDLPSELLPAWCEEHYANLVVNNYPALSDGGPGGLRQRAHTDIGGLTVLWADDAPGGLEVRMPGVPGWTPVRFPPGVLLIQAGDLLACWTNRVVRANIHRVANPDPSSGPANRRTSVVYFHYPRLDLRVSPAPSCVSAARPAVASLDAGAFLARAEEHTRDRYREFEASLGAS